ncbi:MAG: transporter substrate-binding domain-containing protein [Clostridia bacterium]|nr:transporter substrate-binding domain-containing protein [Clostridia bacterium]
MKKLFALLITAVMTLTACFGLTACSKPLTGYDIELARKVVSYLNEEYDTNIEIEFQEIEWSAKEALLENGTIDLVWNGMTITPERLSEMCISVPYLYNKQVAVVRVADEDKFSGSSVNNLIQFAAATIGAEAGSAGEDVTKTLFARNEYIPSTSQLDALTSLDSGNIDVAIIDSVMAGYYTSKGVYKDKLVVVDGLVLAQESYGIAAKKGNFALVSKINEALIELRTTDYAKVADDFGLTDSIAITENTTNPFALATDSSWDNVVASKKLVIGYTVFAPIAYTAE